MYPEHIAVERITHMDRVESDDIPGTSPAAPCYYPPPPHSASYESGTNSADVSPQVRETQAAAWLTWCTRPDSRWSVCLLVVPCSGVGM